MEIKKIIYASCTCMMALSVCGCQKNKEIIIEEPVVKDVVKFDKEEEKEEEIITTEDVITWDDKESDYSKICNSVPSEITKSKEDLFSLIESIRTDYNNLKSITTSNEWRAKSLYKNSCILDLYVTYSEAPTNTAIINISEDIKTYIKLLYNKENTEDIKSSINNDFDFIYSFDEETWTELFN